MNEKQENTAIECRDSDIRTSTYLKKKNTLYLIYWKRGNSALKFLAENRKSFFLKRATENARTEK